MACQAKNEKAILLEQLCMSLKKSPSPNELDDILSSINILYPEISVGALDIVDKSNVTLLQASNGRTLFQVVGNSGLIFHCFDIEKLTCYCSVYRTRLTVKKATYPMCKHLLAIRISGYLEKITTRQITDDDYVRIIKSIMLSDSANN